MPKPYKVSAAFRATVSKEDKTPKTVELQGNTYNVWKVKFEGESDKGWINVNRKPDNDIKPGDELYGDLTKIDGKFGTFYSFKTAPKPLGQLPATGNDQYTAILNKLDHIIALLNGMTESDWTTVEPTPVDLKDLDI